MEEIIVETPVVEYGLVCQIKPGTRFYGGRPDSLNPSGVKGKICEGNSSWHSVMWNNGRKNNYEVSDLIFDEPIKIHKCNINKIYFKEDVEIKSVEDVLNHLYPKRSNASVATYYKDIDSDKRILHCGENRMRSFDDIWIICDTYLKDIHPQDVFIGLLTWNVTLDDIKNNIIPKSLSNCSTIKRIRYTNSRSIIGDVWDCSLKAKYDSKYSWRELFTMIDIKSKEDFKKWMTEKIEEKFKLVK